MKDKFPFREIVKSDHSVRVFPHTIKKSELKWNFDNEDREITFLHESDWKFQIVDQLPINIVKGLKVFIPEGEYYRLVKGSDDLKVKVRKLNKTRLLPHTQKA